MRAVRTAELLELPVRLHGIQLGRPADLLLDRDDPRVLGFDVLCGDGVHRFLPFATATITPEQIAIRSPFVLLEEGELAFYRARTDSLAELRGTPVAVDGSTGGTLADVVVGASGVIVEVVLDDDGAEISVPFDESVRFRPRSRSAA
jgi:hypothetical protein